MKALLLGYYGARNLGDEMMLYCLREWLARQEVEITVLTEVPGEVRGLPAAENVPLLGEWAPAYVWLRGAAWRLMSEFRRHDALIIGGGDLIRDDRGWRAFFFVAEKVALARALGMPVYWVNTGIGEPVTGYGRRVLAWVLRHSRRIVVRDRRSMEVCAALGAGQRTLYAPDIVLRLPCLIPGLSDEAAQPAPQLLVCLRSSANAFARYELTDARIESLAHALESVAASRALRLAFVPFREEDCEVHRRIAAHISEAKVDVCEWSGDLASVTRRFRDCAGVVAMRLHAAVLATAFAKPCTVLPYDHKVTEFARLAELHELLPAESLDDPRGVEASISRALDAEAPRLPEGVDFWDNGTLV